MSLKRLFDIIIDKCNILTKGDQSPTEEIQKMKTSVSSSSKHKSNDPDENNEVKPTSSSYHPPLTRSRSASASGSTSRSNSSGSSSSGSSSSGSGSSSSGSSSSDSDASSSSSDTEASRASQRSRASRSSQRSTNSTKKGSQPSKDAPVKPAPSPQAQSKKTTAPTKVTSASATSSTSSPKKKLQPQDQQNSKANSSVKPKPKPKPVLSGSVTNEKTISLSSSTPLLLKAKPTSTTQVITSSNNKKKDVKRPLEITPVSSTGSESEGKPLAALKRAGTKPKPSKQPALTKANGKATPTSTKKAGSSAPPVKKKALPAENKKKLPTTTTRKKDLALKTIFSPDNSSADEEILDGKKKKLTKKMAPDAQKAASLLKKKVRAAAAAATDSNAAAVYSSSVSATSSSVDSSSSSDSDSSSENEPEKRPENAGTVDAASPKSSTGSRGSRKERRPITRRQRGTVKSKTIPTTTVFSHISQSSGVTTSNQQQQMIIQSQSPYITRAWGDSDFSDDHSQGASSLIRCPTKSSTNKAMRFPTIGSGGEEEFFERKCPYPSCDSQGHLSGKFPTHSLLSTCPKYHDLSLEECKENADERAKRDSERKKYYSPSQPHLKKPSKPSHDAKMWIGQLKELKEKPSKKMDGVCSQYDESLWSDALAHAAMRIEVEQSDGISLRSIVIGRFEMACWCESPYAEPLCHSRRIFICGFCLKPSPSGTVLRRHCAKCVWRHPPGDEIYRKDRLSVWEVDGKSQKGYCQNLCLLAKSFLDHKTLYLDVDPFLFYVMTLADSQGCHLVGYFSKEKNSFLNYNVSCILTLPPYQRQGFGRLLIDFSYLLTRVEGKVGSPEKPLSDLGLISYRSYWKDAVLRRMCACATREMNVKDLSIELGVTSADLISTLQFLGMLKYWKGKHLVLKKQDVLEEYLERVRRRGETRQIEPSCLRWRPYQPPVDQSSS